MKEEEYGYFSERISVPSAYEQVFTHFYSAANKSSNPVTKTLFPSFQTILLFSFGSEITLSSKENQHINTPKCFLVGPIKQPIEYTLHTGAEILVANFKDDAFYRFFGQSMVNVMPVNPDVLLEENCFTNLWQQLNQLNSNTEKITFILDFCTPYLKDSETGAKQLAAFKKENSFLDPIKNIAQETGKSQRTIQLNHKKFLGYSAKELGRYQKFLKVIELLQDNIGKVDWFEVIEACGYYDQSQLIHDFRHYLNMSPTQYLRFQQDICRADP